MSSRRKSEDTGQSVFHCTAMCAKKKRTTPAEKFCPGCQKYFCRDCVLIHNDLHEDHLLHDPSHVHLVDTCDKHSGKVIERYCKGHDELLCVLCATKDHRSCSDVVYIPEISQLFTESDIHEAKNELNRARTLLLESGRLTFKEKEKAFVEKNKNVAEIEEHLHKLINAIERLGKEAIHIVDQKYGEVDKALQDKKRACEKLEHALQDSLVQLEASSGHEYQTFIALKRGQQILPQALQLWQDTSRTAGHHTIKFNIETKLHDTIAGFHSLGTLKESNTGDAIDSPRQEVFHASTSSESQPAEKYQVKKRHRANVQLEGGKEVCNIEGSCLLPDGTLLIADRINNNLKRLDIGLNRVIDHCVLPGEASAICLVGNHEAAVCLFHKQAIQFVSLGSTMSPTRSIQLTHECFGLAYSDGELFVTDEGTQLRVYDLKGKLQRTIVSNQTGSRMFESARHLAVSAKGDLVYVADWYKGLVCVDKYGVEMFRYLGHELKCCHGVATDGRGSVFVCGWGSNNVVQLQESGEVLGEVLTDRHGVHLPQSLCFDKKHKKLFVTTYSNSILVYDLV